MSWWLDALIASALLMAAVILVRGPVRRAFGPQLAYTLWALPALRLLLPPLPTGWWHTHAAAPITRAGETIVLVMEPVASTAEPSLGAVLPLVWAAGTLAFLAWHLVRHARFCARVLRDAEPVEQHDGVRVIASPAAPSPIAFGIWRRYVAFPTDFAERYDADERALALAHELGHHHRRDLHANWAGLVVLALHWFNPLAWRAFRAFRADQELANDARVLAGCSASARHAYGRAIVKAVSPSAGVDAITATCHLHTVSDLKRRLTMLTTSRTSRRRFAAGTATVTLLVAGGLGLTASASAAASRVTDSVGVALQASPTPPTPAAPGGPAPGQPAHVRRVMIVRDSKTTTFEGAAADAYARDHNLPVPPAPPAVPGPVDPTQARTVVVRPDGHGTTTLVVRRASVVPGAPLPSDVRLPKDFELPASCLKGQGGPAQVIKGQDGDQSYTILCTRSGSGPRTSDAAMSERGAYRQALESLHTARGQIASQVTPAFPESDRRDALAAVDHSIAEIEADLAALR